MTYEEITLSKSEIVARHHDFINNAGVKLPSDKLPFMYWIPKFHKNPPKARFIVSSADCTTKSISKPLSQILKLLQRMHRAYCSSISFARAGQNRMFIVENSAAVVAVLDSISKRGKSLGTFDFSTLYTCIPLTKLLEAMEWIVLKGFKGGAKKYVTVNKNSAYFSNRKSKYDISLEANQVVSWIEFLINNTYFEIGSKIYRQCIGIPMGTDAAPFLANLFLYRHEFQFVEDHNNNPRVCARLRHCMRYIDDLLYVGDPEYFAETAKEIYPTELTLNRESSDPKQATFLDLSICVENDRFVTKTFDKRDDFPFAIINYPHVLSNIPRTVINGVIISQFLRFCRVSTTLSSFIDTAKMFITKLRNNGYNVSFLRRCMLRMKTHRVVEFKKFGRPYKRIVEDVLLHC